MLFKSDGLTALETEVFCLTTTPGETQTEAMKIFPASPPLLLKLPEERDTCREEGGAVARAVFNHGHFTGRICKDGSSYPREGKDLGFPPTDTLLLTKSEPVAQRSVPPASPQTQRKNPEQMRTRCIGVIAEEDNARKEPSW